MVEVRWAGNMRFTALGDSGQPWVMDTYPEAGGGNTGPTPVETLLGALAACSAVDVVSILTKKRQQITAYRIEVDGERAPPGQWPRPFLSIRVTHILSGVDLDPLAVARAVELSDEKYCSVMATLREAPQVVTNWKLE